MARDSLAGAAVVVGVDGSQWALAAVDLAAREAALRARPLMLLHAVQWPSVDIPVADDLSGPVERDTREAAERSIAEATARAHSVAADLEIHSDIVVSSAAAALRQASESAALVVVGEHGHAGLGGLLVGSVAVQVATHAACPVLVVRGQAASGGDVVLGTDGSPASSPAVAFAFEEASLRGVGLTAIHAWRHPVSRARGDMQPLVYAVGEVEAEEARLLAEALEGWGDRYPDVVVRRRLVRESAAHALVEASGSAQLLVVGARGHGGFAGLLLGSVGQAMLHRSACPVAVIRPGTHAG